MRIRAVLRSRCTVDRVRDERGDIPGWVMITVMTIVIASAILVVFQDRVTTFLSSTLNNYM